ncbi:vacuolar protein sorting/targeting protein PEP1 [Hypocenomyce scalaris]|nr:vacuolar protein sorting/targeting protein PEP1 [Hypocenomyce scalaris]
MRLRNPSTMLILPLVVLLSVWCAQARKDGPRISKTKFENPTSNLFYFEDTDVLLVQDRDAGNVWRSDDAGETWDKVKDVDEGEAWDLWPHPYDNKVAYILGLRTQHWVTEDQGKSWRDFETVATPTLFRPPLSFHAGDSGKVLMQGQACTGWECKEETYYTTNNFKTMYTLREDTRGCIFAHSTPLFRSSNDDTNDDRILCVVKGRYSPWPSDNRLVVSDNFFETEMEPALEGDRTVQGIISMAVVKGFLVAAAKAENTVELALYVTDDAKTWHRAEFPNDQKLEEEAYTILESTNYSIQVDVMTTKPTSAMGVLFSSNSNGTYFTRNIEHTNRNFMGLVDFEKIQGIQGIVLVNVVKNWEEVERTHLGNKKIQSKISFDDGRTFQAITTGKKELHLHSVSDISNVGRIFSSPAPGLIMGIGNTGDYLKNYDEGDLYVSDDAGLTWRKALDEAHKYEFGDQGAVLVAIYDEGPTNKISYSINHGKDWDTADLDENIRAQLLTTTPDSTSLKFVVMGTSSGGEEREHFIFSIDFDGLHEGKCKEKDFEKWYARLDEDGKPDCLMGHKQFYRRRKADADCFVDEEFKDPLPQYEQCTCTEEDFECDYNFVPGEDRNTCTPAGRLPISEDDCKNIEDTFMGSSGFRLIPGNECNPKGGVDLEKPIERPCRDSVQTPASGKVSSEIVKFSANDFREYYYLERGSTSTADDETVVMRTDMQEIYISRDHGKTWKEIMVYEDITAIYPHQYISDIVYFLTGTTKVHYTMNRGDTFGTFDAPEEPNQDRLQIIGFHPDYQDWLLWTGAVNCQGLDSADCHSVASVTEDRGDHWQTMLRYVRKCEFIKREGRGGNKELEKLVYCEQFKDEKLDSPLQLLSSTDWFSESQVHFPDIMDFATMSEFIIVAAKDTDQKSLKVDASVDGKTFADAQFPSNFNVPVQKAYTVLDSSTHAVFLHVTVGSRENFEYGSIIKSNSNGTSYVMSINGVNRNTPGYVDFEKMQGLEGVAIVNIVANLEQAEKGQAKKLKTMITHNDGAEWALLHAPDKDAEGNDVACDNGDLQKCSLHLHGYTERKDPRDTFSSPSAVGLMMGVGNVGEYLTRKADGDTFITRDGGVVWHAVKKGNYMWEYGDQGSIIVIVEEETATDVIFYTLDEGVTWVEYKFADSKMQIGDISTVPSDNSRNFLLWGKEVGSGSEIATVNLDFTGLTDRQCHLVEDPPDAEDSDYYLWEPKHPSQTDNCLFGHVSQYHRKKPEADCYNGRLIHQLHNIARNCSCTRQDFECDYNYERQSDNSCALVPGLQPADHSAICATDPSRTSYFEPTGYRRIQLTTCEKGRELEYTSKEHPCPGREEEFKKEHSGLSAVSLFFAIVVPILVAGGVGWYLWRNGMGKFGRIRLGEVGDAESPWIQYPIMAVSAVVAVVSATPLLVGSLWRSVSGLWGGGRRYTTRSSFARGRADYAVVDPDEDELLGDEDEEEV